MKQEHNNLQIKVKVSVFVKFTINFFFKECATLSSSSVGQYRGTATQYLSSIVISNVNTSKKKFLVPSLFFDFFTGYFGNSFLNQLRTQKRKICK